MSSIRPIDESTVEALLRARYARQESTPEPAELELVARYVDGQVTGAERARVEALLSADPELAETVALARDDAGEHKVVSLGAARKAQQGPRRRAPMSFYLALAAAVLAVVGVSLFLGQGGPSNEAGPMAGAGIASGAGVDHLVIHGVGEDGEKTLIRGEASLVPGDVLRFEYASKRPGYLMVLEMDREGSLRVLYPPRGDAAEAVPAARRGALAASPELGYHPGCGWIVGIFSDAPFERAQVTRARLTKVAADTHDCHALDLASHLPFARTVEVWPVSW